MSKINQQFSLPTGKINKMTCKCGIQKWSFTRVPVFMGNEIVAVMQFVVCVLCERSFAVV
jgi:hypothetical protein